jgi:hypothetical protein
MPPMRGQSWTQEAIQADLVVGVDPASGAVTGIDQIRPPFVKHDEIAYVGTHRHSPGGNQPYIPPHTLHRIECRGDRPLRYLSVDCFVGGKPAAEPTWESHVRVMCSQNGWDFEKVRGNDSGM